MPTRSLILGDDSTALRSDWSSPVSPDQQLWVDNTNSRANQSPSGAEPADFSTAARDASIAQAAALRYAMTGNAADLGKAVAALQVLAIPEGTFITRPEVLTSYLGAYDLVRGASQSDLPEATRAEIESRLLTAAGGLTYGNNTYSNARAKIGGTKALAGVLLKDQSLLDQGLDDLQGHFDNSTTDDGWFTDGIGHYLSYTLRHVAMFARAYQQGSGVDLYASLQPYADMVIGLRKPDGKMPNVSNGLNRAVPINLLSHTADPVAAGSMRWYLESTSPNPYRWSSNTNVLSNDGAYTSFFALTDLHDVTASVPQQSPTFLASGQSKVSVFRNDWGPTSDYLLLSPGIDSPPVRIDVEDPPLHWVIPAYHSHNDTGEILLAAQGHYILVAPGYARTDLSNSPTGFAARAADRHNVVLVDGDVGPDNLGRTTRPEEVTHTQRLDSRELGDDKGVSDFSTLEMNYRETDVSRSIAFPGEDYFAVADRMKSATTHTYGFNLVGRGVQTILTETPSLISVKWEHEGAQVIEHLVATHAMSLSTASLWMHDTFNVFEQTQRMTAEVVADEAGFLSILETGAAGDGPALQVTNLSSPLVAGARVINDVEGYTDWILSQSGSDLQTVGRLGSDGAYAWLREVDGELHSALIAEGTLLQDDGDIVFDTSSPITMSLLFGESTLTGTISADDFTVGTLLDLYFTDQIVSAMLDGIPLPFTNGVASDRVELTGAGLLEIQFVPIPEPVACLMLAAGTGLLLAGRRLRGPARHSLYIRR